MSFDMCGINFQVLFVLLVHFYQFWSKLPTILFLSPMFCNCVFINFKGSLKLVIFFMKNMSEEKGLKILI